MGEGNQILQPVVGANSVLLLDDDAHREQRRLLMPPFRGNHLTAYAETMTAVTRAEIARWPRGEPVRLHPRMQTLALEVILRAVFGLREGARLDELRAELVRTMMSRKARAGQALLIVGPQRVREPLIRRHFQTVDRLLHAEIRDELVTLLTAGHETTATALAWAVERLARDPARQGRLAEEVRAGGHEFLDATIKETLRLRPVLAIVVRRLAAPMDIGGMPLPAGVNVVPSIYLMHQRPDVYPDPQAFRPERFGVRHTRQSRLQQ